MGVICRFSRRIFRNATINGGNLVLQCYALSITIVIASSRWAYEALRLEVKIYLKTLYYRHYFSAGDD